MVDKVDAPGAVPSTNELTPEQEQALSEAMMFSIVNQYAMQMSAMQSEMKRQVAKMGERND